jgi:hypothetical protein
MVAAVRVNRDVLPLLPLEENGHWINNFVEDISTPPSGSNNEYHSF